MKHLRTAAVVSAAVGLVLIPVDAQAAKSRDHGTVGQVSEGGDAGSGKISATGTGVVQYDYSRNPRGSGSGTLTPIGHWTPPACWVGPRWTPQEAADTRLDGAVDFSKIHDEEQGKSNADRFAKGKYGPFNVKKQGKGYWYGAIKNPDRLSDPAVNECNVFPFWVDNGDPPPAGTADVITPAMLAKLAYAQIEIPQGKATLEPVDARQVVNLPTWVSLDKVRFHPVAVTASIPEMNISATTTATPKSMHIDPGTGDAQVFPAGGECTIHNGRVGSKRPKGELGDPPCGVKYQRSSQRDGTFPFKATITWKVSWTGTNSPGGSLPSGTYGTPQNVTVHEVQTIVR
jgi:enoyl reductase